jgi:3-oxoacyl-[acyl-carrier protein] reductase
MPLAPLVDLDLADLDAVLRTNVRGTFGGAIINISSSVTRFANPNNMAYIASKGAVQAMTLVLARELHGRDITVNAVAPGAVETEMLERFVTKGEDGTWIAEGRHRFTAMFETGTRYTVAVRTDLIEPEVPD